MDYMSDLPSTKHGNDYIFVVVDWFSKMTTMKAYKKNITVEATTKLFFDHVWVHFGLLQTIIYDPNSRFSVHFGPAYGHSWTPSSPNPLPSIPKLMVG